MIGINCRHFPCNTVITCLIVLPFLMAMSDEAYSEIFRWVDKNGSVHFSDEKPAHLEAQTIEVKINTYKSISYDTSIFDTAGKVVIYSASWCGHCKKAKKYFKRKRIPYTEYDIEKSSKGKRQYKKLGATGVPVILVGKKRMNGFSEQGFERIYRQ